MSESDEAILRRIYFRDSSITYPGPSDRWYTRPLVDFVQRLTSLANLDQQALHKVPAKSIGQLYDLHKGRPAGNIPFRAKHDPEIIVDVSFLRSCRARVWLPIAEGICGAPGSDGLGLAAPDMSAVLSRCDTEKVGSLLVRRYDHYGQSCL